MYINKGISYLSHIYVFQGSDNEPQNLLKVYLLISTISNLQTESQLMANMLNSKTGAQ